MTRKECFGFHIKAHYTGSGTVVSLKHGISCCIWFVELTQGEHISQIGEETFDKQIGLDISEAVIDVGLGADTLRTFLFETGCENRYNSLASDYSHVEVFIVSLWGTETGGIRQAEIEVVAGIEAQIGTR